MAQRGLTAGKLAESMRLDRYWRKWLHRVCENGLSRASTKTAEKLAELAREVGLIQPDEFWKLRETEPRSLRRMRDVLAVLEKADAKDAERMRQAVEDKVEEWCKTADELRKKQEWVEQAEQLKLRLGANWNLICERSGLSDYQLLQMAAGYGPHRMAAWLRRNHSDLFHDAPPRDPLMEELAPIWGNLCDAFIASHAPSQQSGKSPARTPAEVGLLLRQHELKHGTEWVLNTLKSKFPEIFGTSTAE